MNIQSHYGELAIDLLCGQVERSESQTQTNSYVHTFAHAERNDHSVTCVLGTTNLGTHQYIQKPFTNTLEGSRNAEQIPKQNTPQKSCTELAAEFHFAGFSKDVFQCRPPTNFWGYLAGIFAPPKQENSAEYVKSVHGHFFKMPSRQDDQFFYRTGSVGKCTSSDFWVCKQLLLTQLIIRNSITKFDYLVQG
jgi:hypothetical protein